jgi:transaldolase
VDLAWGRDSVKNPLRALRTLGQSVWLDDIRRGWLEDGTLARLIAEDGLSGLTSNPAIFEKAMAAGDEYAEPIRRCARLGLGPGAIYESLALDDIRAAADLLRPTYDAGGADGFASLEVSPHLADDTEATLREARRLWQALDRPNGMIKVPGTRAGLPAIGTLLAEGVNVNVTLLFGVQRYREVVDSFLEGLERRAQAGRPVDRVASVASFFISRIDTLVDGRLDALGTPLARELRGRAAIAAARLAHEAYTQWTATERWARLAAAGARPQRLLWASTSSKDPAYEDTRYVEMLVAPGTVSTMPRATLDAYRDHGRPALWREQGLQGARLTWKGLYELGIDPQATSEQLEREGIRKFVEPFDSLHARIEARARELA